MTAIKNNSILPCLIIKIAVIANNIINYDIYLFEISLTYIGELIDKNIIINNKFKRWP